MVLALVLKTYFCFIIYKSNGVNTKDREESGLVQADRGEGEDQLQGSTQGTDRFRREQAHEGAIPRSMIIVM